MKNVLFLLTMLLTLFTACSDDDGVALTPDIVIGTWNVTWAEQNGESMDIPEGYILINLKNNGSYTTKFFDNIYIGKYKIDGNTVVGTTLDPITERYTFTKLDGNYAEISYSNSEGNKYKFHATKK